MHHFSKLSTAEQIASEYPDQLLSEYSALIYKWKQRTKGEEKQLLTEHISEVLIDNQRLQERVRQLEIERDIKKSLETTI